MESKMGIYKILNNITNKIYIGSSINLKKRITQHKNDLKRGNHHSIKLQRAYNKYSDICFIYDIVEYISDIEELLTREQYYIDKYNSYKNGYNCRPIANSSLGMKCSEETVRKISNKLKENYANGYINPNFGKTLSESVKFKISKTKKGCKSNRKGSKHTDETKEKMSKLREGKKWNPNYNKHSEETKNKIKESININGHSKGNSKKCIIHGIKYDSAKDASINIEISYSKVIERIKSKNFIEWYFIE